MKITCKNCGDLPIFLPALPKGLPGMTKAYTHRIKSTTPCPECGGRGTISLHSGMPDKSLFVRDKWKEPDTIAAIQRIHGDEIKNMNRNAEAVLAVQSGRATLANKEPLGGVSTEEYLAAIEKDGAAPIIGIDVARSYPINSFSEFVHHFFESVEDAQSLQAWEAGYTQHLKKADIFFLGEESDMTVHTEDVCTSGKLPFLMPFKNCLFFMRASEVGAWDVFHLYQIEDFLGRWRVPNDEGAKAREIDLLKAVSLHGDKAVGYRVWRSGPDIYDAHSRLLEADKVSPSVVKYQMVEQAHLAICPELQYETGMWAALNADQIAPTYTRAQRDHFIDMMCGIDAIFNIAAISSPALYTVKVVAKKTKQEVKREKRGIVDQRKRDHFIIIDYERVTRLNPGNRGNGSPVRPHKRRAHWRRVSPNYKNLIARGVERIPVREAIIGKDRFEDEKNQYHVLTEFFAGGQL